MGGRVLISVDREETHKVLIVNSTFETPICCCSCRSQYLKQRKYISQVQFFPESLTLRKKTKQGLDLGILLFSKVLNNSFTPRWFLIIFKNLDLGVVISVLKDRTKQIN